VNGQEGLLENVFGGLGIPAPPADETDQGRMHVPNKIPEGPFRRGRPGLQGFQEGGRINFPREIPQRLRNSDLDLDSCILKIRNHFFSSLIHAEPILPGLVQTYAYGRDWDHSGRLFP
jgi:hypothetical protein